MNLLVDGKDVLATPTIADLLQRNMVSFSFTDTTGRRHAKHRKSKVDKFSLTIDGLTYSDVDNLGVEEDGEVTVVFGVESWEIRRLLVIDEIATDYGETVKVSLTGKAKDVQLTSQAGKVWKNKTDSEIAEDIAKTHGFDPAGIEKTTVKRSFYAQAGRTFMDVLLDLAEDNGFYVKIRDNTLVFASMGYDRAAALTLYMKTGQKPELESFSLSSKRSAVNSGAKVDVKGMDKGKGEATGGTKEDKDAEKTLGLNYKTGGGYTATTPALTDDESRAALPNEPYSLDPSDPYWDTQSSQDTLDKYMSLSGTIEHNAHGNKDLAYKRAAAVSERILWKGVNATAKTRDVKVNATEQVNIAGAIAKKHAGTYYADEVTYSLDGLSFAVDITLSRKPFGTSTTKSKNEDTANKGKDPGSFEERKSFADMKPKEIFAYGEAGTYEKVGDEITPMESSLGPTGGAMSVPL